MSLLTARGLAIIKWLCAVSRNPAIPPRFHSRILGRLYQHCVTETAKAATKYDLPLDMAINDVVPDIRPSKSDNKWWEIWLKRVECCQRVEWKMQRH